MDNDSIVEALLNGPDVDGVLEEVRRAHQLELNRLMDQQVPALVRRAGSSDSLRSSVSHGSRLKEEPEARRPVSALLPPTPQASTSRPWQPLLSPATEDDDDVEHPLASHASSRQMTYSVEDAEHWLPPPPRRSASTGPFPVQIHAAALVGANDDKNTTNEVCMSSAPATPARSADVDGHRTTSNDGYVHPTAHLVDRDSRNSDTFGHAQQAASRGHLSRVSPVITPNRSGPMQRSASGGHATTGGATSRLAYYQPQVNVSVKAHRARQTLLKNYASLAAAAPPPPPDPSFLADDGCLSRHFQHAFGRDAAGANAPVPSDALAAAADGALSPPKKRASTSGPSSTTVVRLDPFLLHAPYAYAAPPEEEHEGPLHGDDKQKGGPHVRNNGAVDAVGGGDGLRSSSSASSSGTHGFLGRQTFPSNEFQQRSMEVEAEPLTDDDDAAAAAAPRRVIEHQQHRRSTLAMQANNTATGGGGAMHGKFRNSLLVVQTPNNTKRNASASGNTAAAAVAPASVLAGDGTWMPNQAEALTDSTTIAVDYFENSTSMVTTAAAGGQQNSETTVQPKAAASGARREAKGNGQAANGRHDGTSSTPRDRSVTTAERQASPLSSSSETSDASYSYSYSYGSESDSSTGSSLSESPGTTRQQRTAPRPGAPRIITPSKGGANQPTPRHAAMPTQPQQRSRPPPKPTEQSAAAVGRFQAALRSASFNHKSQSLTTPTLARSATSLVRGRGAPAGRRQDIHQPMLAPRRAMSANDLRAGTQPRRGVTAASIASAGGSMRQQQQSGQTMRASTRFDKPQLVDSAMHQVAVGGSEGPLALSSSGHWQQQRQQPASGRFPPPPPPVPHQQLVWESSGHVAVPSRFTVVPPSPSPSAVSAGAGASSARFIPPPPVSRPMPVVYRSQSSGATPALATATVQHATSHPGAAITIPHYQPRPAAVNVSQATSGAVPVAHVSAEYHGRHATFSADGQATPAAAANGGRRVENFAQRRFAIEVVQH